MLPFVLLATTQPRTVCDNSSKGICKPRLGPIHGVLALALAMVLQRATGNKHFEFASSWVSRGKDWTSTLPERQSGNGPVTIAMGTCRRERLRGAAGSERQGC